jgi:hypothetical protein
MKKLFGALATLVASGLLIASPTITPAFGSQAAAAGLQISVIQSEFGAGPSRTLIWNVTITDSRGRDFITTGVPTSNQILVSQSSARACQSAPVAFSANSLNSGTCTSYFTRMLNSDLGRVSTSSGTITYDLTSSDSNGSNTVATYEAALASTTTYGAVVAYLRFDTDSGQNHDRYWNLYGSTGSWTPTPVAGISVVAGQGGPAGTPATTPAPIKYSGPEFSSLSLKPVLSGTATTLEGRKLDQISSITIDGKPAKISDATDKSLKLELPAGLKPGAHDMLVVTVSHGKLTHMNAFRVREVMPDTSLTIKGSGVLSGEEFKKLTAFARTQNPEMNTATCIVNSNSEGKSFMQARALCDRIAATNLNIKTTMFETRSTVQGSAIFARVVFGSEE